MDELIREALREKAKEIEVPAGAWKQVREQIRPSIRVGLWKRFRLGARLELVATVAILVLLVAGGTVHQARNRGVEGVTPASLTVTERAVATQQEVGDETLKLPFHGPVSSTSLTLSRIDTVNDMLKPFGYRLEQTPEGTFDIYHVDKLILHGGFSNFSPVTVSERQDNFIFMVFSPADRYWLIDVNGVREWDAEVSRYRFQPPVYVHNELVSVQSDSQSGSYTVWRNGQRVFTVPLKKPAFGNEIKRLTSWSDHWVLEVIGDVYVDGQSLSKQLGYDEVFEWRLVDGRPLYLFREGSQFGVAYDSKVLAYHYEQVLHNLCCEPSQLNPVGNEVMVHFYGLRQGTWYWVEMQATGEPS
jgi:hypothetical protein